MVGPKKLAKNQITIKRGQDKSYVPSPIHWVQLQLAQTKEFHCKAQYVVQEQV